MFLHRNLALVVPHSSVVSRHHAWRHNHGARVAWLAIRALFLTAYAALNRSSRSDPDCTMRICSAA